MDVILALIMIPIALVICLFIGALVRQHIFKSDNTQNTFGNNVGNIIVGLIVMIIAFIIVNGLLGNRM